MHWGGGGGVLALNKLGTSRVLNHTMMGDYMLMPMAMFVN